MEKLHEIFFAGGCFWGTEHFMKQIRGVRHTEVGYANSLVEKPSYEQVCTGRTAAAETVRVLYDPTEVSLALLIDLYMKTINPTNLNHQGEDRGTQYRTGIYFKDLPDLRVIQTAMRRAAAGYDKPLAVEVMPIKNFYPAEEYHQDYLGKKPDGYCHIRPELFEMARKANEKNNEPEKEKMVLETSQKR